MQEPITVSGIQLVRIGDYAIVNVEVDGKWVEVIREHVEGSFSHIVEPSGIRTKLAAKKHGPISTT